MRKIFALILIAFLGICAGCGGGHGSTPTPPPPPQVTVFVSPTTATVNVGASQQFTATVSNAMNTAVTWAVNGVGGGNATVGTISASGASASYAAPAGVPNPATVVVTATSVADPTKSATAQVTITQLPPPATITISPTSALLIADGTQQFTATVTNTTNTAVSWTTTGNCGTVANGLFTAANVAATCQGKVIATSQADSSRSASADVTVDPLPPPAGPTINSAFWTDGTVSSPSLFCYTTFDCLFRPFVLNGQNFAAGDVLNVSGFGSVTLVPGTSPTQFTGQLSFDRDHFRVQDPEFSITRPATGQVSNLVRLGFIGDQKMVARWTGGSPATSKLLYLDQALTGGKAHLFDVSNLTTELKSWNSGGRGVAVDPSTEVAVTSGTIGVGLTSIVNPNLATSFSYPSSSNPLPFLAVAAADGNAVGTQDLQDASGNPIVGNLVCATYTMVQQFVNGVPVGLAPVVQSVSAIQGIGTTPIGAELTKLNGQLSAVVLVAGDGALAVAPVPLSSVAFVLNLPGFTKAVAPNDPQKMLGGSWLTIIETGTQRLAVAVDRAGKQFWFADLLARTVSGPFALAGDPFGVAADNVHGAAIVKFTSLTDGTTRLARIMPDGTRVDLTNSFSIPAAGHAADAGSIYGCGGAATCESVPNP